MKLFQEKKSRETKIERDTIGADEGGRCMDDKAVKDYVKIAGLDYVSGMIKGGMWRITEKGRVYLENLENERMRAVQARAKRREDSIRSVFYSKKRGGDER